MGGCLTCKNLQRDGSCLAWKNGIIPIQIKSGDIEHTKPFPGQVKSLVYEFENKEPSGGSRMSDKSA